MADLVLFYMQVCKYFVLKQSYSDFKLKRIRKIPQKRHIILVNEIFSARPSNAIPVVTIKIIGPTKASKVLIYKAFSKSLSLNIIAAAVISILPDSSLNAMMKRSAFSINGNTSPANIHTYYMQLVQELF